MGKGWVGVEGRGWKGRAEMANGAEEAGIAAGGAAGFEE